MNYSPPKIVYKILIGNAKYSKNNKIIKIQQDSMFKSIPHYILEHLKGRYTGREQGYIVSPNKAKKFVEILLSREYKFLWS